MQCPNCLGKGKRAVVVNGNVTGYHTCSRCNGTGNVSSLINHDTPFHYFGSYSSSSSKSSSSSTEKESPVVRFFKAIGFEDIDYFGYQINIPVSILLSLVISACITFLAYVFIPQKVVIVAIVSLVLSFFAFACTHIALRVILIIIAAIGLALGIYTFVSPSKSKPATTQTQTQTVTVNANVNFRAEPATGDNIIRQLQQGDTVTLTGETNGSWTQIQHNGDVGWISTEFLNK